MHNLLSHVAGAALIGTAVVAGVLAVKTGLEILRLVAVVAADLGLGLLVQR
ncbi:MAG: hypothetical protein M0Z41_16400 [Peptococcaceae bacterium]|nr:hypothetical protein [Peptococcaceae bacterium]